MKAAVYDAARSYTVKDIATRKRGPARSGSPAG